MSEKKIKQILSADEIEKKLDRIATEIAERNMLLKKIALVGIVRRGVPLAKRLAEKLSKISDIDILVGSIDITLYGADHNLLSKFPILNGTDIQFPVENIPIILVDDILYTGKTIHKAINAIMDIAEPSEIQLVAFLDRGRRTFPISADYTGLRVPTASLERVALHLDEVDGIDEVIIEKR